jgi:2-succinyl-6-hydroxy-2,4-cyclohexadiene-1-carboxylate synthase
MKPVLYLFHGMGGNKTDWDETAANLLQFDLRALELSDFFSAKSPEDIAKKIALHISSLSLKKEFSLCGYSLGGRLAILTAKELATLGCPPKNLILVSAGLGFSDEKERQRREKVDSEWAELARDNTQLFWQKWYTQDLFSTFAALAGKKKEKWLFERKGIDSKHLAYQLRALSPAKHPYLRETLTQLVKSGISVLYIAGELDKKYLNLAHELGEDYRISVAMIAQTNHLIPLEAPVELAKLISNFFAK